MKRSIYFLLFSALFSLGACQETNNSDNSEIQPLIYAESVGNDSTPQRRRVYVNTVNMWHSSYQTLLENGVFGRSLAKDKLTFKLDSLNAFKKDSIVEFWIYLDNYQPKFAIANESDSTSFLISNGDTCGLRSYSTLQAELEAWKHFVDSMKNQFVYVKKYSYTWSDLLASMDTNSDQDHNTLVLEVVAHSVTTDNKWFEVEQFKDKDDVIMEGYIAIDILISGTNTGSTSKIFDEFWQKSNKYDFALPCPKACL